MISILQNNRFATTFYFILSMGLMVIGLSQPTHACTIPASGPWPACATGGTTSTTHTPTECVIPESGAWPACATNGKTSNISLYTLPKQPDATIVDSTNDYIGYITNQSIEQTIYFFNKHWVEAGLEGFILSESAKGGLLYGAVFTAPNGRQYAVNISPQEDHVWVSLLDFGMDPFFEATTQKGNDCVIPKSGAWPACATTGKSEPVTWTENESDWEEDSWWDADTEMRYDHPVPDQTYYSGYATFTSDEYEQHQQFYATNSSIPDVIAFYNRELPAMGYMGQLSLTPVVIEENGFGNTIRYSEYAAKFTNEATGMYYHIIINDLNDPTEFTIEYSSIN